MVAAWAKQVSSERMGQLIGGRCKTGRIVADSLRQLQSIGADVAVGEPTVGGHGSVARNGQAAKQHLLLLLDSWP